MCLHNYLSSRDFVSSLRTDISFYFAALKYTLPCLSWRQHFAACADGMTAGAFAIGCQFKVVISAGHDEAATATSFRHEY
jgi:hypothetical protein